MLILAGACAWGEPVVLHVRLHGPLTSYHAKAGHPFSAVVTAPAEVDGRLVIPSGTIVHGTVRRVARVGLGLVRERAALDLEFHEYELADGRRVPISARLASLENARETVTDEGRIKGILAASNPQSFVSGLWYLPKASIFHRSLMGLTGASGKIGSQFAVGPAGVAVLFGIRAVAFRMPEPEIRLPRGTEMKVLLTGLPPYAPSFPGVRQKLRSDGLSDWITGRSCAVQRPGGQPADDIVNIFFTGSREQLLNAFAAAGWTQPDALNRRSFARAYKAYASQSGYATAPVSKLLYEDREPDLVFQKSFNTLSKRHHVRIWRAEADGQEVWLGAATEDVGITFSPGTFSFTHRIDLEVDKERDKIVHDLDYAGCAANVSYVEREAAASGGGAKEIVTDGRAAVIALRDCPAPPHARHFALPLPPGSAFTRAVRRTVLEARHYLLRGNAYYWAWRGLNYRRGGAESSK